MFSWDFLTKTKLWNISSLIPLTTDLTLTGRCLLDSLLQLLLELLLREGPLRLAVLSVGVGGGAGPAPLLPLLVLKCWLQLTLYLWHSQYSETHSLGFSSDQVHKSCIFFTPQYVLISSIVT